jgi:hypothetical protein
MHSSIVVAKTFCVHFFSSFLCAISRPVGRGGGKFGCWRLAVAFDCGVWLLRLAFGVWRLAFGIWPLAVGPCPLPLLLPLPLPLPLPFYLFTLAVCIWFFSVCLLRTSAIFFLLLSSFFLFLSSSFGFFRFSFFIRLSFFFFVRPFHSFVFFLSIIPT